MRYVVKENIGETKQAIGFEIKDDFNIRTNMTNEQKIQRGKEEQLNRSIRKIDAENELMQAIKKGREYIDSLKDIEYPSTMSSKIARIINTKLPDKEQRRIEEYNRRKQFYALKISNDEIKIRESIEKIAILMEKASEEDKEKLNNDRRELINRLFDLKIEEQKEISKSKQKVKEI